MEDFVDLNYQYLTGVSLDDIKDRIDELDIHDRTVMMLIGHNIHDDILNYVIDISHNTFVNQVDKDGKTIISKGIYNELSTSVLGNIIYRSPDHLINMPGPLDWTPIMYSIVSNNMDAFFLLLNRSDTTVTDYREMNLLMLAIASKSHNYILYELINICDISHQDIFGKTALFYALEYDAPYELTTYLIDHSDLRHVDKYGRALCYYILNYKVSTKIKNYLSYKLITAIDPII